MGWYTQVMCGVTHKLCDIIPGAPAGVHPAPICLLLVVHERCLPLAPVPATERLPGLHSSPNTPRQGAASSAPCALFWEMYAVPERVGPATAVTKSDCSHQPLPPMAPTAAFVIPRTCCAPPSLPKTCTAPRHPPCATSGSAAPCQDPSAARRSFHLHHGSTVVSWTRAGCRLPVAPPSKADLIRTRIPPKGPLAG